jgi:outer membrane protein
MRRLAIAASLIVALSAASAFAQGGTTAKPAPKPAPAAAPAPAPEPPQAPVRFPQGAAIAYVNIQRIASESIDGKAAATQVQALVQKKQSEGADQAKALQANQSKLAQGGTVMSDVARAQLEKEVERQTTAAERFQQDAQAEINELQQQLQNDFQVKLFPILQQLGQERGLQVLFSATDAGILWADGGLDLTAEVLKRLDGAAAKSPTTAKP